LIFDIRSIFRRRRKKKTPKPVRMALDLVDAGDNEKNYSKIQKVTHHIPEGVTSRMLYRDIIRIAWPSFIELTLTQLTSMVDMMMVGGLGSWAIAAVGLTNQPKFLLMIMFISMNVGATALVARYKGEGSPQKANMILRQALLLTFVLSLISSIIGFVFSEQMVRFMGATETITLEQGRSVSNGSTSIYPLLTSTIQSSGKASFKPFAVSKTYSNHTAGSL
jgi:O-antigen/teichoic acid export membrane protein